jgi:hypothetical protein
VDIIITTVADYVSCGAVVDVTGWQNDWDVVRTINSLTVAMQASGEVRVCWNGRIINPVLPTQHFNMQHAQQAANMPSVRPGDLMFLLDVNQGHHQCPLKDWFK